MSISRIEKFITSVLFNSLAYYSISMLVRLTKRKGGTYMKTYNFITAYDIIVSNSSEAILRINEFLSERYTPGSIRSIKPVIKDGNLHSVSVQIKAPSQNGDKTTKVVIFNVVYERGVEGDELE